MTFLSKAGKTGFLMFIVLAMLVSEKNIKQTDTGQPLAPVAV